MFRPWVDPYPYPWRVLWVTHGFLLYFTSSIDYTHVMLVITLLYTCLHLCCCIMTHLGPTHLQLIVAPESGINALLVEFPNMVKNPW